MTPTIRETQATPPHAVIALADIPLDLVRLDQAIEIIVARAAAQAGTPLAVASVNLDHIHHFGPGARWNGALDRAGSPKSGIVPIEWLNLADGAPIVAHAARLTGRSWPRLAGSDLIGPILDRAESDGFAVGFLGGTPATQELLAERLTATRPSLSVSGYWAPTREELGDPDRSRAIARSIAAASTDVLIVGLGKPRQEIWIAEYGALTGASVLLAFGAVVDFLAGQVERAPAWVAGAGAEWAWRLALEPRRLARRYLLDGPPAYLALRRSTTLDCVEALRRVPPTVAAIRGDGTPRSDDSFVGPGDNADAAVIVVTFNNEDDIAPLLDGLHREARELRLRVIVVDNDSTDQTLVALSAHRDLTVLTGGGNAGYAGGINAALRQLSNERTVLVLNPDLVLEAGCIAAMLARIESSGAGIVVPRFAAETGESYPSLRREPTLSRSVGDALVGRRFAGRPGRFSEIDYDPESYRLPHRVDWATGAALLIRRDLADRIGAWEEAFFLYSEETDYFRRAREAGETIWFEPAAVVRHRQGGSGTSDSLTALLAVNRVRYAEKHGSPTQARLMRASVALHEALRSRSPEHRRALRAVTNRTSWPALPHAVAARQPQPESAFPGGAIIIPAHNEQAVIARTLRALTPLAAIDTVEIIVSCNGCSDDTAAIARTFPGVRVIEIAEASKIAALNAADEVAVRWPRLYLDADIEIDPRAVHDVFDALTAGELPAARPAYRYDTSGASALVKRYYRARERMPSLDRALWGAGAYALSAAGHARFDRFPAVTADDLWVDRLFRPEEKRILACPPVLVRTPKTADDLLAILRRNHRGTAESDARTTAPGSIRELASSVRGPGSALDATIYGAFAVCARLGMLLRHQPRWERDDSSREELSHVQ